MLPSIIERKVLQLLEKHFDKNINIKKRIRVVGDLYKFNYKEDKYIWGQKRGKVAQYFAVYFDDEFVVGFTTDDSPEKFLLSFWQGLKKLYKEKKIVLNEVMAKEKKKKEEFVKLEKKIKKKKKIDSLPETTEVEKLAKEAVKRVSKSKKKRPSSVAN